MSNLNPLKHVYGVYDICQLLISHRQLTWEMTKKELTDRYAGQVMGTLWVIGHPLILMAVYTFVFVFVLKARIPRELPLDYTTYLLSGLLPWMCFQEVMSKSTTVILNESNLVKQVVFPIEILPVKIVLSSLASSVVAIVLLVAYIIFKHGNVYWTFLLLPFLVLFQTMAMLGVAYILASVGVFFRDLKDIVQVFCFAGIFLMPIFYLPSDVPLLFKPFLYANPFSYLAWCYRDICYYGSFQHPFAWGVLMIGSLLVFYIGYGLFYKLKHMFGNVL